MQISWIKLSATGRETIYVSLRVFSADGTVSKCQQQRKNEACIGDRHRIEIVRESRGIALKREEDKLPKAL